jgi:hypothetical protein
MEHFVKHPSIWKQWEETLRTAQGEFISEKSAILNRLADDYALHFTDYINAYVEAREHHLDPHLKRELRKAGWLELYESGELEDRVWLRSIWYKCKKGEIAKVNKYIRCIGDLGVKASLQGFRLTWFLKDAMHKTLLRHAKIRLQFIKSPSAGALEEAFRELIEPSDRGYFCYFSDDSCFSVWIKGKVHRFNIDISSCDVSHTKALFEALIVLCPSRAQDDMRRLVEQCMKPFTVRSYVDRHRKVKIKFNDPVLASGSTITTVINNLANILLGIAFAEIDFDVDVAPRDLIMRAALKVGYVVTVEDATEEWHLLQFLKNSPVVDTTGRLRALLNIGVLLRLSGVCRGDLPGQGPIDSRSRFFQAALLQGAYPRISTPLVDNMKQTAGALSSDLRFQTEVEKILAYKAISDECFTVDSFEAFRRYRLTPEEEQYVVDVFGRAGPGTWCNHSGLSKILHADYGLSCREPLSFHPNDNYPNTHVRVTIHGG